MKKLKLRTIELGASEILSREQLKKVLGGSGSGSSTDACAGKSSTIYCRNGSGEIVKEIEGTGCPTTGAGLDSSCSGVTGYDRSTSSCTC
ncbi:hypothetical protein [Parafilimonas sp.]|uniref:hypothetical protein n=1 Tax=Parafilimonas sp. TaxID=1969739 RepID=UPI0039E3D19E